MMPTEAQPPDPADDGQLRARTVRGMGWNLVGVWLQAVLQIGVLVLLARLVTPEEFGVVAAALIVVSLTSLVAAAGLGPALVQLKGLTEMHVRVAFTTFLLLGAGLWLLVTWQAGSIADLFGMPDLQPVIPVMGSVLLLRNLTVGDWLLQRRLDFRTLAVLELQSYAVGFGLVSVTLALMGAGLASIVAGHVVQAVVRTTLLFIRAPHPARPALRWRELRDLLEFGGGHVLGLVIGRTAVQGDNLIVGRWLGPVALGLYGRAYQLMVLPSELIGQVANRVLFPSMASVHRDRPRLGRIFLASSAGLAIITVPTAVFSIIVAPELVHVVLGADWLDLVPAFRVMAIGIVLRTGFKVSDALLQATGHVYKRAARLAVYAATTVGGAFVGQRWGITGVAAFVLGALAIHAVMMTQLALQLTELRWGAFLRAHVPAVLTGAATVLVVGPLTVGLRTAAALPPLVVLGAGAVGLAATGLLTFRTAPSIPAMHAVAALVEDVLDVSGGSAASALRRVAGGRYTPRDQAPDQTPRHDNPPTPSAEEPEHELVDTDRNGQQPLRPSGVTPAP